MIHKYGEFSHEQIAQFKKIIRKNIFFLLLYVDPNTKQEYENINIDNAFNSIINKIGGFNSLLNQPVEIVTVLSLLESARIELEKTNFNFNKYRKLILDAGAEVLKIKEV